MLRTHTYLSSSNSVLHCVTFSCASKCHLRCWRWTFESSPTTGHHVGYAEFPHPLVQQYEIIIYMFSSSSPPRYIGWILRFGRPPYQHAPASDPLPTLTQKLRSCKLPAKLLAFVPYPWASSWHALPSVPLHASLGVLPLATCQNPSARHDWPYDSFSNLLWFWLRGQTPGHEICAFMKVSR